MATLYILLRMDAKQWALNQASEGEAGFFNATFATESGVREELALVCRFPSALLQRLAAAGQKPGKAEVYLGCAISAAELDDERSLVIAWMGLRLITEVGEARWICALNPCEEGRTGFGTLAALPNLNSLKIYSWAGETPFEFELIMEIPLKARLSRVLGAVTGCDRVSPEEFEGAVRLTLDDAQTRSALVDQLFPDEYSGA